MVVFTSTEKEKARLPVGLFQYRHLSMTPVALHNPDAERLYCCFLFRNILFLYVFILGAFLKLA